MSFRVTCWGTSMSLRTVRVSGLLNLDAVGRTQADLDYWNFIPGRDRDISVRYHIQAGAGASQSCLSSGLLEVFPSGYSGCFVKLATDIQLLPGLGMRGALPSPSLRLDGTALTSMSGGRVAGSYRQIYFL